ncbi:MAG TPA: TrkA family potassium uptake protein [Acidimicrobiales bacterium]|nr:TrkA family potassium uptake protein [Acidimicrobiales bacterium]
MHVIVVGCGRLGSELAVSLDQDGHTVSLIDKNRNAFERYLPERWAGRAVLGFGFDRATLDQAGITEAGAVAAVTGGDNSNILTARVAKETFQVPNVVARIQDPRRAVIYQRLGIPTVASVAWASDQVMRRLFPDRSVTEWSDATGSLQLLERSIPEVWAGKKLGDLSEPGRFQVVSVTRGGQARLLTPDLVGQEGDILHLAVTTSGLDDLEARLAGGAEEGH